MKTTLSGAHPARILEKSNIQKSKQLHVIILAFLLNFLFTVAGAQSVANYTTSRNTAISYGSIASTGNSFAGWRNTGSLIEDDNRSVATDIGFDFWYNGQRFTQFSVSTNGFLDFSTSADTGGPTCDAYGFCNSEFTVSANGTWLALAPFYDDMTTQGGSDPLGTSIKYLLSGTAPDRVLTIEWINMAVFGNTTPALNFQVELYETTGRIEFLYGTMITGTNVFSYTLGINAATVNGTPLASQLKTQQTANSNTFNNTPQNNLSTLPQSNSQVNFVSPTPTVPAGSLTIGSITRTGMTLSWPNWATNEVGYVLYNSTDNLNFFFHSQTAADATSSAITNLLPGTTYYWRVSAVTEGTLSNPLSNNATTLAARNITSVTSGRWDVGSTWDCNCVPTQGDNVFISNVYIIEMRSANMQCNDLTVGQGTSGVAQFTTNTAFTLTINGNLTINTGASFTQPTNSNATHTVNIRGNILNNGTLNLSVDGNSRCAINFTKTNGNQLVSGSGTNTFHTIALDKATKSNLVEITASNFSCNADALTFTSGGTFKFSSSGTNTFQLFNSTRSIPVNNAIWMNSTNSVMQFGASVNLEGDLRVDNGTVQIGNAANENLVSFGGQLEINGGLVQIAGRYTPNASAISRYQQTGGSLICPTISSTSTTEAPFSMTVVGSSITMTGGSIILQREGGTGAQNLGLNTSGVITSNVTTGTLQIGNGSTPATQTFLINAGAPVGNLLVASSNATAQLTGSNLIVVNNITVNNGVLNDGGRSITFGGNWLISGGSFQSTGTGLVTANGGNQSITTNGSAFNDLTFAGSGTKSLQDNIRVNGDLTFSTTLTPINTGFVCTLGGDWINNGSFTRNSETILLNGSGDQIVSGSSLTNLTNITVNKSGGRVLVNGSVDLHRLLTIQSATQFDADGSGSGVFTLLSTGDEPTADASIATLPTGASVTGNVSVQRYMAPEVPGVTRVYRYISSPVSGRFISDWQDDFPITGNFSNPNTEFPIGSGITTICGRPLAPNSPSLFRYAEPNTGTGASDLGWVAYPLSGSTTAASIEVGRGYAAFIRECSNPTIVDVRGPVNQGTISFNSLISLTNNGNLEDGFNLVGNPFPSAVDWNTDAGWIRTGISPVIYVRDNGGSGGFITYDHTDNVPMVLATGQAFWVRVTSATPNFSVNEQAKTTNAGVFYRTGTQHKLVISLAKDGVTDQAIVKLNSESSAKLDDFDGPKLDNTLFDISTLSEEGISMAVNSINQINCGQVLSIRTKDMTNGTYQLLFNLEGKFEGNNPVLVDKFTASTITLSQAAKYSFVVNNTPGSKATNRFELHFPEFEVNRDLMIVANPTVCENKIGFITILDSQKGIDYYAAIDNLIVSDTLTGTGGKITLRVPASNLKNELNEISVLASRSCGGVFEMTNPVWVKVSEPQLPVALQTLALCKSGSVTLAVEEPTNGIVQWFSSSDAAEVLATGTSFTTPVLTKSRTYYASVVSEGGCQGNRIAIEATVTSFDDVEIRQVGDTLISSYDSGNQWYRDGELLKTETSNKIVPATPGVYKVVVQISDQCSTSTEVEVEDLVTGDLDELIQGMIAAPNPAEDFITVTTDNLFDDEIYLVNIVGQELRAVALQHSENQKEAQIELKGLPEGFYYLKGRRKGKTTFLKIIKQ